MTEFDVPNNVANYVARTGTGIQIVSFKEVCQVPYKAKGLAANRVLQVIAIAQVPTKQKNLPLTKSLNWYVVAAS
jgi:hypothetical protein